MQKILEFLKEFRDCQKLSAFPLRMSAAWVTIGRGKEKQKGRRGAKNVKMAASPLWIPLLIAAVLAPCGNSDIVFFHFQLLGHQFVEKAFLCATPSFSKITGYNTQIAIISESLTAHKNSFRLQPDIRQLCGNIPFMIVLCEGHINAHHRVEQGTLLCETSQQCV